MNKLIFLVVLSFLFACNNGSGVNDKLLQPHVLATKEFIGYLQDNDSHHALAMVDGYDEHDPGSIEYNKFFESNYEDVSLHISGRKLKSMAQWRIIPDEMHSRSNDYSLTFEEILIPFERKAENEDDPVYLYIGFSSESPEHISEFGIITKRNCNENGDPLSVTHSLSPKQSQRLHS